MNFNISTFQFAGSAKDSYADLVRGLCAQLMDLGHQVSVADALFGPPIVNLVMEGFDPGSIQTLASARDRGAILWLVATEMPTRASPRSFLWNNRVDAYWTERAHHFAAAAPHFVGAWCLVPGTSEFLGSRHRLPSIDVDVGFSPRLVQRGALNVQPEFDFCFFGSRVPRRDDAVAALRRAGHSVLTVWDMGSLAARDEAVARSRVVLDLKIAPWWPVVSTSRISAALHSWRPCVCEPRGHGATQGAWMDVAAFAPKDEGLTAVARAALGRWGEEFQRQMARFEKLDARRCLGAAVDLVARATGSRLEAPITALPPAAPEPAKLIVIPREAPPAPPPAYVNGADVLHGGPPPALLFSERGYNYVAYMGHVFVAPQRLGALDFQVEEHRNKNGVRRYRSLDEARAAPKQ